MLLIAILPIKTPFADAGFNFFNSSSNAEEAGADFVGMDDLAEKSVSYTHLTLPTKA